MEKRDIAIGLGVVALVILGIFLWSRGEKAPQIPPSPTISPEDRLERSFKYDIPEDHEKVALKDVSGGNGSGLATRNYEKGVFTHVVLADLPDPTPPAGGFYEGWLTRGKPGDANFAYFSSGKMRIAKGGYLLEFQANKDYSDHKGVVITLEKIDDKKPEKHILEGSF